jgi:CsoR family transcriptional regulator, copper-sensing transcriptional repressor
VFPDTARRGYTSSKDDLLGRLSRVEGQVRGVAKMIDEDRYCIDVLTQIAAIRAALEQISLGVLNGHARHRMLGEGEAPDDPAEQVQELMGAVGRLVRS